MKRKILFFTSFFLMIVLLFTLSIILTNHATNTEISDIDQEKSYYEIQYLNSRLIEMANALNGLNKVNSSSLVINWEEMQDNLEILYTYWNSVILDFNTFAIDKNELTDFGKKLDELAISIKNKNKADSLNHLVQLYQKLTIYIQSIQYSEEATNLMQAKYHLLIAYSIVEKGNWTLTHENILKSDEYLSHIVHSIEESHFNQYNVNQAFIAIKELENLIHVQDLDLFYLKYQIAITKLENI